MQELCSHAFQIPVSLDDDEAFAFHERELLTQHELGPCIKAAFPWA